MKNLINFKSLMVASIVVLFALPAFSQGGPPQERGGGGPRFTEEDVKNRVKRLSEELNMSDAQEKKITDYEVAQYKKNQVEMQKNSGDREKMRNYMVEQRELRDKKYEEVLDENQYKKFKVIQEQRRQEMRERREQREGRPGEGGGDRPER